MKIQEQFENDGYKVTLEAIQTQKELKVTIYVENVLNIERENKLFIAYKFYVSPNLKKYYEKTEEKITENTYKKKEKEYNERTQQYREVFYFDEHSKLPHRHTQKFQLKEKLVEEVLLHLFMQIQKEKTQLNLKIGSDGDKKDYDVIITHNDALKEIEKLGGIIYHISNEYEIETKIYRELGVKISDENAEKLKSKKGIYKVKLPPKFELF